MREIPTDTAIITWANEGIRLQHPMLYKVLENIPELSLVKLYKEISKRTVSERSNATASLIVNRRYCYSEEIERREGGHMLAN